MPLELQAKLLRRNRLNAG
ncbi:MAG: hypothetical protein ABL858_04945 [Candidatus Nitrotoga sp.]